MQLHSTARSPAMWKSSSGKVCSQRGTDYLPPSTQSHQSSEVETMHMESLSGNSWRRSIGGTVDVLEKLLNPVKGMNTIDMASAEPDESIFPVKEFCDCLYRAVNRYGSRVLTGGSPQGFEPLLDYLPVFLAQRNIFCESRS